MSHVLVQVFLSFSWKLNSLNLLCVYIQWNMNVSFKMFQELLSAIQSPFHILVDNLTSATVNQYDILYFSTAFKGSKDQYLTK